VSGEETFQFAAAVAGVSIGLAAVLILSILAVVGTWRLFRDATKASEVTLRAALNIEDLAGRMGGPALAVADSGQLTLMRQQTETLIDQQQRLQEMARNLIDASAMTAGPSAATLEEIQASMARLDANVGQMAAVLANLIQLLERQQPR
jgi:hypothetical protein